jgi:adhesin/invasin
MKRALLLLVVPAVLTIAAPRGVADTCPTTNSPNTLKVVAGARQTAQLGRQFLANLQVQFANTNGCAITDALGGIPVVFTAPGSGPSGTFATSGANQATVGADANGTATAPPLTANDTTGFFNVTVTTIYGLTATFTLENTNRGVVASIAATGGTTQSATVNAVYAAPLQARVLDATGQPVQGISVAFSLGNGTTGAGASFLGGGAQTTALTNSAGYATSPEFVANGTPGRFTATAATSGLSSVATYALDNHATTTTLAADGVTSLSATVNGTYAAPLAARVVDANGQPVEGATVTFALVQGAGGAGATFVGGGAQAIVLTDAQGRATSPSLVATAIAGRFTATASTPGAAAVTYQLVNHAAAATLASAQTSQSAHARHEYAAPLRAQLLDANGQPVEGATVTFALVQSVGGAAAVFVGGGTQATAVTDANGNAVSPRLVANATAGAVTATATALGAQALVFSLHNLADRPAAITAGAAPSQSTAVRTRFPIRLAVTVKDANGNAVESAAVTFTAPTRGPRFGSGRSVTVKTGDDGVAVAPALAAGAHRGGFVVTARVRGTRLSAAFALVVQ